MIQGFSYEEAAPLVDAMYQERTATIRRTGIVRVVVGAGLMATPVIAWFVMSSMPLFSYKLFALPVMAGVWGIWMLIKGIFMIASPRSESGDVAEK
jgi:uncharacterized membrane protein HdeD (DUF308 family)